LGVDETAAWDAGGSNIVRDKGLAHSTLLALSLVTLPLPTTPSPDLFSKPQSTNHTAMNY